MSRKTRRHPNRPKRPGPTAGLRRISASHYETDDGIVIQNVRPGERSAYWIVTKKDTGEVITRGYTLAEARKKINVGRSE